MQLIADYRECYLDSVSTWKHHVFLDSILSEGKNNRGWILQVVLEFC